MAWSESLTSSWLGSAPLPIQVQVDQPCPVSAPLLTTLHTELSLQPEWRPLIGPDPSRYCALICWIMMLLRQLSYAIKTQLKAPKWPKGGFRAGKWFNTATPCSVWTGVPHSACSSPHPSDRAPGHRSARQPRHIARPAGGQSGPGSRSLQHTTTGSRPRPPRHLLAAKRLGIYFSEIKMFYSPLDVSSIRRARMVRRKENKI